MRVSIWLGRVGSHKMDPWTALVVRPTLGSMTEPNVARNARENTSWRTSSSSSSSSMHSRHVTEPNRRLDERERHTQSVRPRPSAGFGDRDDRQPARALSVGTQTSGIRYRSAPCGGPDLRVRSLAKSSSLLRGILSRSVQAPGAVDLVSK